MIVYNFRKNGPIEYEKMILNILQYHNEVTLFKEFLEKEQCDNLLKYIYELEQYFNNEKIECMDNLYTCYVSL